MILSGGWLQRPETTAVCAALAGAGWRVLFVGGCVRNSLLGRDVDDIDIATDAPPEAVVAAAGAAGLKALPTGIAHGTVTVVSASVPYEVTTFRRDVESFGRHARVAFDAGLAEDAARRDFTINALFATPEGVVLDPLGTGLADLAARRVRFVGDPARRIAEDGLRILRFFRFHAWYADPLEGIDAEGLAACAAGLETLGRVSAERRGTEMRKLLSAPDPAPALAAMAQSGVLAQVLPGADAPAVARLRAAEAEVADAAIGAARPAPGAEAAHGMRAAMAGPAKAPVADWILRLAALDAAGHAAEALRLSRADAARTARLRDGALSQAGAAELGWRLGVSDAAAALCLRAALTAQPMPEGWHDKARHGAQAVFPVVAADLMPALTGPALGQALARLQAAWLASDMQLGRAALIARVPLAGERDER